MRAASALSTCAVLICALALAAEELGRIEYACSPEDIDALGLTCSPEDPCAVFLELSSVQAVGAKLFLAGNLHTASTTIYSILLMSEDGGKTWTEPFQRLRSAALVQMQFVDLVHGWVSGHVVEPLPRDQFILLTTDGGKTWSDKPLFEDSQFGSIAEFRFESPTEGALVLDRSQGNTSLYDLYETMTGGESWTPKETGRSTPIHLKKAPSTESSAWRVRAAFRGGIRRASSARATRTRRRAIRGIPSCT